MNETTKRRPKSVRPREEWTAHNPFMEMMGFTVEEAKDGRSRVVLPHRPEIENRKGDAHGGVVAALLDVSMTNAVRGAVENIHGLATVSATFNYLAPARGTLIGHGKVLKIGGAIAVATADIIDESGAVVAQGVGNIRIIRRKERPGAEAGA